MSRVYQEERVATGDVLAIDEPNAEVAALVGEMNGRIDRDNLDEDVLTGAKVNLDVFHRILWVDDAGPDNFTLEGGADGNAWQMVESGTLTTDDGMIDLYGSMHYDTPAGSGEHVEIGIRVDGVLCARSGSTGWFDSDSPSCCGTAFVGPGSHTIELILRIMPGWFDGSAPTATDYTIAVNGRSLWAREVAR